MFNIMAYSLVVYLAGLPGGGGVGSFFFGPNILSQAES
jgi:hypothetical protein